MFKCYFCNSSKVGSNFFLIGEISPKHELKYWKIENEVILEVFNCHKWEGGKGGGEKTNNENCQISIFWFWVCNHWFRRMIKVFCSNLVYSQMWLNVPGDYVPFWVEIPLPKLSSKMMWLSCENSLKRKKKTRMKGIHKITEHLVKIADLQNAHLSQKFS
jgi:hypothetical protein